MLKAEYQQRGPQPHEVIAAVALQLPEPGAGQVRIKVLAAPINPSDVLTLTGEYGMLPPLPAIGGNEGVGRVEALGAEVSNLKVGQMVLLPVGCGTWVSHLNAAANKLIPLPEADPQQLAMLTVNPPTASLMLSEFVDLKPGDWVIQNAANSGVGSYLIQLAKLRGFKTINVVRRESAVAGVEAEGGDLVLVDGPDLAKRVRAATGGRGGFDTRGFPCGQQPRKAQHEHHRHLEKCADFVQDFTSGVSERFRVCPQLSQTLVRDAELSGQPLERQAFNGGLSQQELHQGTIRMQFVDDHLALHAIPMACALHHGLVRRGTAAHEDGDTHHALLTDHRYFRRGAVLQHIQQRNNGRGREIDMAKRAAR